MLETSAAGAGRCRVSSVEIGWDTVACSVAVDVVVGSDAGCEDRWCWRANVITFFFSVASAFSP